MALADLVTKDRVTQEQWDLAKKFFDENPKENKFSRKVASRKSPNARKNKASRKFLLKQNLESIGHSFVKVDGKIYAMQPEVYLGKGGFGAVKKCFDQNGQGFAIKIKSGKPNASDQAEAEILNALDRFHGATTRTVTKRDTKAYSVQNLVAGKDVLNFLKGKDLTEEAKYALALHCALTIKFMHDKNIIHGDIAARNIMIDAKGGDVSDILVASATAIDFGLSVKLEDGVGVKKIIFEEIVGINPAAPGAGGFYREDAVHYDKPYDLYLLGHNLFQEEIGIATSYNGKSMVDQDKDKRPTINEVIVALKEKLQQMNVDVSRFDEISLPDFSAETMEELMSSLLVIADGESSTLELDAALKAIAEFDLGLVDEPDKRNEQSLEQIEKEIKEVDSEISKLERQMRRLEQAEREKRREAAIQKRQEKSSASASASATAPTSRERKSAFQISKGQQDTKASKKELMQKLNHLYEKSSDLHVKKDQMKKRESHPGI